MSRTRIHSDRILTNTELKRRFDERHAAIDAQLDEAFKLVDWKRRDAAKASLKAFIKTYCIGLMLDDLPSQKAEETLDQMDYALKDYRPQQLMLPRGSGKTTFAECAALYQLAYGMRKFFVIVSQNSHSASSILKDIKRMLVEKDTAFAQDFPEICKPIELCNGFYRRRQTYKGVGVDLQMTSNTVIFPRIVDDEGRELPASGSVIAVRGIGSGIRGMKVGKLRPDSLCLDDLQDNDTASNPEQVEKLHDLINKDILNLSSKGKMSVIMTATPLYAEDLTEKILNDVSWKTTKYKAIISWPKDIIEKPDNGLWHEYFIMFDAENIDDKPHTGSLEFYKKHKEQMDEGAVLFQPDKFKTSDGHISGLQALLEKRHLIGDAAFEAELQMTPTKAECALAISPNKVAGKIAQSKELEVPDGFVFTTCAIDLNTSYGLTYNIVAFKTDMTAVVIHHDIMKVRIDQKLADTAYNAKVHEALLSCCEKLKKLGVKIDAVAIDAGGRNWDAVCQFAKQSKHLVGLPCCAFSGRASNIFNPFVRTRLRDAINRTVLCGNAEEHVKAGSGNKYVFFDADWYKAQVQRALLQPVGSIGSCSLYKADSKEHAEFAIQVCNEKLQSIVHKKDGRDVYSWKSKNDHDYLDTMAMCYAIAGQQGISGKNYREGKSFTKPGHRMLRKPKIRIM